MLVLPCCGAGCDKVCFVCHFRYSFNSVNDSSLFVLLFFLGDKAKVEFRFKDYNKKADVFAAVDRIQYRRENTNMTGGFKVTRLEVFGKGYQQRPNVVRLILLITDGVPTWDVDKLHDEVAAIKNMGIRVVGLAVTNLVCLF